jgi:hypothetical protein
LAKEVFRGHIYRYGVNERGSSWLRETLDLPNEMWCGPNCLSIEVIDACQVLAELGGEINAEHKMSLAADCLLWRLQNRIR